MAPATYTPHNQQQMAVQAGMLSGTSAITCGPGDAPQLKSVMGAITTALESQGYAVLDNFVNVSTV